MPTFFVEHHEDKTVVELMGIMKNIIAIGIGMIDGLALGENLK
jgi:glycerol-3-phosphate dehydrogenase